MKFRANVLLESRRTLYHTTDVDSCHNRDSDAPSNYRRNRARHAWCPRRLDRDAAVQQSGAAIGFLFAAAGLILASARLRRRSLRESAGSTKSSSDATSLLAYAGLGLLGGGSIFAGIAIVVATLVLLIRRSARRGAETAHRVASFAAYLLWEAIRDRRTHSKSVTATIKEFNAFLIGSVFALIGQLRARRVLRQDMLTGHLTREVLRQRIGGGKRALQLLACIREKPPAAELKGSPLDVQRDVREPLPPAGEVLGGGCASTRCHWRPWQTRQRYGSRRNKSQGMTSYQRDSDSRRSFA